MAVLVRLPKLAANVAEGAVGPWLVREGDAVCEGDKLVEIITSKATFDLESPTGGLLGRILAPEKSSVPVGYVLAIIGQPGETIPDVSAENNILLTEFRARALPAGSATGERASPVRATPGARRLARELGVNLESIRLPDGRNIIREEDVKSSAG